MSSSLITQAQIQSAESSSGNTERVGNSRIGKDHPTDKYRYKPQCPELVPFWDAFYENPYPSTQEYAELAQRLQQGWRPDMIRKFFEQARRFTHAPQRGPNCDTEPNETQGNEGHEEGEEIKIRGPLDSYFGEKEPQNERPSKRDRDGLLHTNSLESKKAKTCPRGPRGPYSKQSSMTLWRRKVHAQKHASDIQQFFPTKRSVENVQEHIVVEDEPDLEDIASGSDDRAGSSESTRHRKI